MVSENTQKIEGLKKSIDFAIEEIKDVKKRIDSIENKTKNDGAALSKLEEMIIESERHSRRWNLELHGVPETVSKDDVKETIHICQTIFPEGNQKLPDVIDIVHCLGKRMITDPEELSSIFPLECTETPYGELRKTTPS